VKTCFAVLVITTSRMENVLNAKADSSYYKTEPVKSLVLVDNFQITRLKLAIIAIQPVKPVIVILNLIALSAKKDMLD